jgi:hypothetical protein
MSAEALGIPKGTKRQKFLQKVWLDAELMSWCLTNAESLGLATNAFIVEVLRKAKEFCEKGSWAPLQVVERTKVEKEAKVVCPFCRREFGDFGEFERHVEGDRDLIIEFFESRFGVGVSFKNTYACPKCKVRFESEKEFLVHVHSELPDFIKYVREEVRKQRQG